MKLTKKLSKLSRTQLLLVAFAVAGLVSFGVVSAISSMDKDSQIISQANCSGICVSLKKDVASPDTLAITVGSFVQFNSADGKPHSLSLGEGGEEHSHTGKFTSGKFEADEAWRVQFNKEGTFTFHDHYNPKLNVIVVVYTEGKEYKVQ